ncbi:T9SS type A sorting domain-containing protein [Pseudoflavitalea sp. G-6-1-2]|uniref:fibronectin type III domain-containing protein n=1 Tax=Pseudoflavitalea sp. G-6-1-2 TaxID=2728841 RepID=UPI00146E78DC|nr:fibronectin type III domain-containing protein [Pseudoflavitalea sp. G-6-1-2]NML19337.1 T9SS type A sorting domain-containing protein [Pseudoflavitalea sp. G-6-1-2]
MKKALLLSTMGTLLCIAVVHAQNVFNPADPQVRYNSSDPSGSATNPNTNIQGLQKWVSTPTQGVSTGTGQYDASAYKAYYINFGGGVNMCFRLKFPKSYTNPDSASKKYPLMVFFHGAGEPGCPSNNGLYNNERQLVHGGRSFLDKVNSGQFDGFLLYPQAQSSTCWSDWGTAPYSPYYGIILSVIDSLVKYARADIDRVLSTGLSNGGAAAWSFTNKYPQRVAKAAPSAAANGDTDFQNFIHIPIWFASGGKDTNPSLGYAQSTRDNYLNNGGDIRWTMYPDLGHAVWDKHWSEPDFVPFMNSLHKANPLIFYKRNSYCPDSAINSKIGITPGFAAYEWQKDNNTIAKFENNTPTIYDGSSIISFEANNITVKSYGTYRVRFKRSASGPWSDWSPIPAVISPKPVTQTPNIAIDGLQSIILPAPDGSTTVQLKQPEGFFGYNWFNSSNQLIGTSRTITVPVGNYTAKVVEDRGCGSLPSPVFKVVPASGSPKPDAAKNLTGIAASLTSIQLDWSENPNAGQNETGYEIYRSTTSGGPYRLLTITGPDVLSYLDQGLTSNTSYYYIVRAVSAFGAAPNSNETGVKTEVDLTAPTAPSSFTVSGMASNYAYLKWNASTDNVGVVKYEIYINGSKTYTTKETSFNISNLNENTNYTIYVKAVDAAGNASSPSNQVTTSTTFSATGINWKYYEGTGWISLPNFNVLTPVKTGSTTSGTTAFDFTTIKGSRTVDYGILWEGYINITVADNYTFKLSANDGANLYIGSPYGTPEKINNDGSRNSTVSKTGTVYLSVGVHPIAVAFYHNAGSNETVQLTWKRPSTSEVNVPLASLFRSPTITGGTAPTAPSNLVATGTGYNRIQLSWNDNSNNETGFELVRSTAVTGPYLPVATLAGSSYLDSGLSAETKYYYKVRAISPYGESAFTANYTEANWKLNNDGSNASGGNSRTLGFTNTSFNNADVKEGTHALSFNGTNAYAQVNSSETGAFPSEGAYDARTVAMWIKPTAASFNKRMIFDFGNINNGLALRFNGNGFQYSYATNNSKQSSTTLTFASIPGFTALNTWNHVAVTYTQNATKLFVNGVEVQSITNTFTSKPIAASNASRLGYSGGSANDNSFGEASTANDYFAGLMDNVFVVNSAMTASEINALRLATYQPSWDTTLVAPSQPAAPSSLAATLLGTNNVKLTWNDNSSDETGFEVYRSLGNTTSFRLVATVDGGAGATKTYTDSALFANVTYYYKVLAKGQVSPSGYSNTANAATLNSVPVIETVDDFSMTYGTSYSVQLKATDVDGDPLTFNIIPSPYFASITNVSNGIANLTFTPSIMDMGVYNIKVVVSDGFNGFDTTYFSMLVNNNAVPVINNISDVNMNEGATPVVIPISATDEDGNSGITWRVASLPSFATLVDSGNGRGSITLAPSYNHSGTYTLSVIADDEYGAWSQKDFVLNVAEVDPNDKVQINMFNYTGYVALWNDIDVKTGLFNVGGLRNIKNQVTTVGIQRLNNNANNRNGGDGAQVPNDGGIFPNNVLKDYLGWGGATSDDTLKLRVRGLDPARKYNFVFYASNTCPYCGFGAATVTTYKIGSKAAEINFYNNISGTDTIYQVQPSAGGDVFIDMIGDPNPNIGGYLNALVIETGFDDGSTPVKPLNLQTQDIPNTGVKLTWEDKAYNETSYKVYRASVKAGPYTLLNPGAQNADAVDYSDNTTQPYANYYYFVVGNNKYGDGATSDTVHIATANNKPVIASLDNIFVKTDATVNEDFTVTDNAGDVVTVTVQNKPGFVSLLPMGGNNYRLVVSPTADNIGFRTITIKAEDDKGGVNTQVVNIGVADKNTRSFYINTGVGAEAPAPWTNMLGYGNAGMNRTNLRDENNVPSNIAIQLVEGWGSVTRMGHQTGNNSGVYPDVVLSSGIIDDGNAPHNIKFSGLDQTKRYNLIFVGSQNEGTDGTEIFTAGAVKDTLQARNNTNLTANLNGLTPNASGEITVSLTKASGAVYIVLNAVQIEEYAPAIAPMGPVNLYVEPVDRTSVLVTWSDRLNNENSVDGFELQRASDSLFSSPTSTALAANTTSRLVTGLNPNTKYWFRVRAKVGSAFTDFSNRMKTITPQSLVYFNFNFSTPDAAFPWNNASENPAFVQDFTNLKNYAGQPSGLTLSIVTPFNGENVAGVVTGNNSGIVPDAVLQSCFWLDKTQVSTVKVSGLNQNKRYRFGFIGSIGDAGWDRNDYTATYTINGRTVYLNSWENRTKIVYIGDVVPDANGEVNIDFSTTADAAWGFNSGLIIGTYDDASGGTVPNFDMPGNSNEVPAKEVAVNNDQKKLENEALATGKINIKAYPNPFNDNISLDFYNKSTADQVRIDIYDLSGRLIYKRAYGQLPAGINTLRLNIGEGLGTGIYMVTLVVNGKPVSAAKMLRAEAK